MGSNVELQQKTEKRDKTRAETVDEQGKEEEVYMYVVENVSHWRCRHFTRRIGESDDGDDDCVRDVQVCRLGGQDRDNLTVNERWGVRCRSQSLQLARHTNKRSSLRTWAGLSAQAEILV